KVIAPWHNRPLSTRSLTWQNAADSSSRPVRFMAVHAQHGTTVHSASNSRKTSSLSGGTTLFEVAVTWSVWTHPLSCPARSGKHPATSKHSSTHWPSAAHVIIATATITCWHVSKPGTAAPRVELGTPIACPPDVEHPVQNERSTHFLLSYPPGPWPGSR